MHLAGELRLSMRKRFAKAKDARGSGRKESLTDHAIFQMLETYNAQIDCEYSRVGAMRAKCSMNPIL